MPTTRCLATFVIMSTDGIIISDDDVNENRKGHG